MNDTTSSLRAPFATKWEAHTPYPGLSRQGIETDYTFPRYRAKYEEKDNMPNISILGAGGSPPRADASQSERWEETSQGGPNPEEGRRREEKGEEGRNAGGLPKDANKKVLSLGVEVTWQPHRTVLHTWLSKSISLALFNILMVPECIWTPIIELRNFVIAGDGPIRLIPHDEMKRMFQITLTNARDYRIVFECRIKLHVSTGTYKRNRVATSNKRHLCPGFPWLLLVYYGCEGCSVHKRVIVTN